MSNPNLNYSSLDSRYTKPTDVFAAIAAQATTDAGQYVPIKKVTAVPLGNVSGTVILSAASASSWTATLTGNTIFNFTNIPVSGMIFEPQVEVIQNSTGGYSATFQVNGSTLIPTWVGVAVSIDTTPNNVTLFNFQTLDGGITWLGFGAGGADVANPHTWAALQTFSGSLVVPTVTPGTTTIGGNVTIPTAITDTMVTTATGVSTIPDGAVVLNGTTGSAAMRFSGAWRDVKTLEDSNSYVIQVGVIRDVTSRNGLKWLTGRIINSVGGTADAQDSFVTGTDGSGNAQMLLGPGSFSADVGVKRVGTGLLQTVGRLTAPAGAPLQTVAQSGGFADSSVTAGALADGIVGIDTSSLTTQYRAGGTWYAPDFRELDALTAQGYGSWTYDSADASSNYQLVSGSVYVIRVPIVKGMTYSNIDLGLYAAGSTFTASQSYVGLYNAAGTLLTSSADMGTSSYFGAGAAASGYVKECPVTTSQVLLPGAVVWVAILATATTMPKFAAKTLGMANAYQFTTTGYRRTGIAATGATSLPSTITPSALSLANAYIWAALR